MTSSFSTHPLQIREYPNQSYSTEEEQFNTLLMDRLETLTNQTSELRSDVIGITKYNAQIRDLGEDAFKLMEPIMVVIEEYPNEDSYIASYPELEVFGEGSTESEAIMNLKLAILDLYDDLLSTQSGELGDLPKNWLHILKQLIIKSNP